MQIVSFELDGDVAVLTMDDGKANALSPSMIAQLNEALDRAEREAKAVLLTGREGKLCAGFDLKVVASGPDAAVALFRDGAELLMRMYAHPQPLVVAATGHAIAGGALLLGVADRRIGMNGPFKIGLNEVSIGMPLPIFAYELARARLAPTHLYDATLAATLYDPEAAVQVGWLDRTADASELPQVAHREAARLAKLPAGPYALTKRGMRGALISHIGETLEGDLDKLARGLVIG
ncbi:MAG TPA: crotonase/enoyl-CoA hydratase family protein [Polyangiaceae bacterium]|nr:crotonase/enoyl-CoA hydratase family protein [Polyangiaceae bacterium]